MTQLEAALREGSLFVVREDGLGIVARTSAGPTSGLVFYDLRTCLRAVAATRKPKPRRRAAKKTETSGCVSCSPSPCCSPALLHLRRRREAGRERVHVHFDDGSTVTLADDAPDAQPLLAAARRAL